MIRAGSAVDQEYLVSTGLDTVVGSEAEQRAHPPQECLFGMLTRTLMRAQFAVPSSHGAGFGLCSTRLQHPSTEMVIWLLFDLLLCCITLIGGY